MGEKKIVLDTNILISSLGWEGNPRHIFEQILEGKFELLISAKQLKELLRVLEYPKFKFNQEQKDRFISIVLEASSTVEISKDIDIIKDDPSDNFLLECAADGKADFIISGDKHLLKLKEFKGIKILTPKRFLDLIKN